MFVNRSSIYRICLTEKLEMLDIGKQGHKIVVTQQAITCSKLTIETLEQGCEICSKLTINITERCQWRRSGVFIVNFKHILHLILLVFLLLTLSR